jgi:hypothetical protein
MVAGPKMTLVLQRFTDDYTAKTRKWSDIRAIKGVLGDLSGREAFIIGQLREKADHEFTCDKQTGITLTVADRFRSVSTVSSVRPTFYKIKRVVDNGTFLKLTLETGTGENVG